MSISMEVPQIVGNVFREIALSFTVKKILISGSVLIATMEDKALTVHFM